MLTGVLRMFLDPAPFSQPAQALRSRGGHTVRSEGSSVPPRRRRIARQTRGPRPERRRPGHAHPSRSSASRTAARLANIEMAFLPFRAPGLMPPEELWQGAKAVVAADRGSSTIDETA